MAIGERTKMGDKYRTALTATVLTYIDTAKQLRSDPLVMTYLQPTGAIVLGEELSRKLGKNLGGAKDSVYWLTINPRTGAVANYYKLGTDLSKWRKALNKQLKAWDQKSAVKQLSRKRATTAGVIAAVTVAIVVLTIVTVGAATGPAAAAAAAGAGSGGAAAATGTGTAVATGVAAGGGGTALTGAGGTAGLAAALKAAEAISKAAQAGKSMNDIATAALQTLPADRAQALETQAIDDAAYTETAISKSETAASLPGWVMPAAGVTGVVALVGGLLWATGSLD